MIVPSSQLTDDSNDVVVNGENSMYRRKYFMLLQRCDQLQKDNENIVHRIQEVRKLLKRTRKDRKLVMTRLDHYSDTWRTASQHYVPEEHGPEPPAPEKPDIKPSLVKVSTSPVEKSSGGGRKPAGVAGSTGTKRKSRPDPLAPKRPANPFFQFCQEQRTLLTAEMAGGGEGREDLTKQELTKLLATRWKTLSSEEKKVYYEMYEKQKEKYAIEMQIYTAKGGATNIIRPSKDQ